jgi:hypothetical protein
MKIIVKELTYRRCANPAIGEIPRGSLMVARLAEATESGAWCSCLERKTAMPALMERCFA